MSVSRRRGSRYLRLVATAVVVGLLVELSVRVIAGRLPDPLVWHSYEAQLKVEQMDGLAATGGARIVFLGSSMMNSAVDPERFLAQAGGDVVAYNASLGAGLPQITVPWAENVVYPRLDPQVVVIGLSSLDLAARNDDLSQFFANSEAARLTLGTASVLDLVEHRLGNWSALFRHRASLRNPKVLGRALIGQPAAPLPPDVRSISPLGFQSLLAPERYDTRDGRARRALERALPRFEVGGLDVRLLARFVERSEADGRQVVMVIMPVTQDYVALHPQGAASYSAFEVELRRIANEADADVVDLDGLRDPAFFADENHLNGRGTRRVSANLASAVCDLARC